MSAVRIRIYSSIDFHAWRQAGLAGTKPGLAPYGLEHLATDGVSLIPRQLPPWLRGRVRARVVSGLEWRLLPLVQPLQLMRRPEDVALAILEREGTTHALLRRAGVPPWSHVPLVLVSCWMADEVLHASRAKVAAQRALLETVDLIVYWSRNQTAIFRDYLGVDEARLCFVPFGVETDFYRPATGPRRPFVLSVGRDRGRDWHTLLAALNGLDVPVKLVCSPDVIAGRTLASNVELIGQVDHVELRDLLGQASIVALANDPDLAYPTGQTVMLNAMAVGTPVILTDSVPMRDYVRHGENSWVVPARDPGALRDGIRTVLSDPDLADRLRSAALDDVRTSFNAAAMWRTVGQRIRELVDHRIFPT